ncbi:hypothetical protein SSAG_00570 [Streptomyces sp. Mg1]|nr:hypothetical protein SSAG_00570 [Streptomyces sp. Mg1]
MSASVRERRAAGRGPRHLEVATPQEAAGLVVAHLPSDRAATVEGPRPESSDSAR